MLDSERTKTRCSLVMPRESRVEQEHGDLTRIVMLRKARKQIQSACWPIWGPLEVAETPQGGGIGARQRPWPPAGA